jgi:hypothetical protein
MAEDILTGLSRHRWLFVIARNSSFTYKGRAVDVRQVGRELGIRYVLEGSVRRAGSRVRFTAQLVDTTTGNYVWGEKYDGEAENLFDLQDRITEAVVGVLEPTIQLAEIERARRKRPENLGAYDYYLRALALTDAFTRDAVQAMQNNCLQAIALDPTFAPAYALAARTYIQKFTQVGLLTSRENVPRFSISSNVVFALTAGIRSCSALPVIALPGSRVTLRKASPISTRRCR